MRRRALAAAVLACALAAGSCVRGEPVNDETGSVPPSEPRLFYHNGAYVACGSFYSQDGLVAAMRVTVTNNIISGVDFDYFDASGRRLSAQEGDEAALMASERRQLNSSFLASQDIYSASGQPGMQRDYTALAGACVTQAREGGSGARSVALFQSHRAQLLSSDGNTSVLETAFSGEKLVSWRFGRVSDQLIPLERVPSYTSWFFAEAGRSYESAVSIINAQRDADSLKITVDPQTPEPEALLYADFNSLADEIMAERKPYTGNPARLFSR